MSEAVAEAALEVDCPLASYCSLDDSQGQTQRAYRVCGFRQVRKIRAQLCTWLTGRHVYIQFFFSVIRSKNSEGKALELFVSQTMPGFMQDSTETR